MDPTPEETSQQEEQIDQDSRESEGKGTVTDTSEYVDVEQDGTSLSVIEPQETNNEGIDIQGLLLENTILSQEAKASSIMAVTDDQVNNYLKGDNETRKTIITSLSGDELKTLLQKVRS